MRRLTVVLAVTLLVAGLAATARPAAAADPPVAEPYSYGDCSSWSHPNGTVFESCYQHKGVLVRRTSPSGNVTYVANGEYCSQFSVNGEVDFSRCTKSHLNLIARDGGTQVYHSVLKAKWSWTTFGTTYTCVESSTVTYVAGEVRHGDYQVECTPES